MVNTVRKAKYITYKVKLKRKEMKKQENTEICIIIDDDFFTTKLQLCKWFKESFNMSLVEAKHEMDRVIECWECNNKPPKYLFFKKVNPKEIDIDKLIMNSPKGISVSRKNPEIQTNHSKEFDEISSYPKNIAENITPVYIVPKNYMDDLKAKCKKLDEENNKLREQLNLKELSDALARCENLRIEAKKWKEKYNDLLGSIKSITNQFN